MFTPLLRARRAINRATLGLPDGFSPDFRSRLEVAIAQEVQEALSAQAKGPSSRPLISVPAFRALRSLVEAVEQRAADHPAEETMSASQAAFQLGVPPSKWSEDLRLHRSELERQGLLRQINERALPTSAGVQLVREALEAS